MSQKLPPPPAAFLNDPHATLAQTLLALDAWDRSGEARAEAAIGLSSNVTIGLLGVYLRKHAAQVGVRLRVHEGAYDDPLGDVERFRNAGVDTMLVIPFFDNILPSYEAQLRGLSETAIAAKAAEVRQRWRLVFEHSRGIRQVWIGTYHRADPGADNDIVGQTVRRFNQVLREEAAAHAHVALADSEEMVQDIGLASALDWRFYQRGKAPYSPAMLERWARRIRVQSRGFGSYFYKALVLDCDNTLWGGVIGEDLLQGIQLDPYDPPGNMYWRAQQEFASLEKAGILLCLCSKNNPADVDEVLRSHPAMVLRDDQLALKKINWQEKPANLRAIAQELDLGLDSIVFLDDSPFECEAVRQQLPTVKTMQVPQPIWRYPEVLREIRELMLSGGITTESGTKTQHYRQRAAARELEASATSREEYLRSLDLRVEISRNAHPRRERISELSLKSNQFNLTTRRYTVAEIVELMAADDADVFSFDVSDRFGSAGLTGVAVLRYRGATAEVEAFLMSCRVIGRGIEMAVWPAIVQRAREKGAALLEAEYRRSAKNAMVADFYDSLGLEKLDQASEHQRYRARLEGWQPPSAPWVEAVSHSEAN